MTDVVPKALADELAYLLNGAEGSNAYIARCQDAIRRYREAVDVPGWEGYREGIDIPLLPDERNADV